MIDVKQILCPLDFSENSTTAAAWARNLAESFGAELHYLYVCAPIEPVVPEPGMAVYAGSEVVREIRESAQRRLDEAVTDPRAVKVLREGVPWSQIVDYAEQNDIDLIVMGTHGRSGLSHLFLGSVAEKVVRHAPSAVLTVRPGVSETGSK